VHSKPLISKSGRRGSNPRRPGIYYFEKLPDVTPTELRKLMRLARKAEDAIATLPKPFAKLRDDPLLNSIPVRH